MSECPICLNALVEPVQTRCGHSFCRACFTRALEQGLGYHVQQCPMCRQPVSWYSTLHSVTGEPLRRPQVSSIFGSVYLQRGAPGVAAYHFVSPEECFISYESAPSEWRLEDGSAPPARKHFEAASYDADSRTFRGTIDWGDNPFGGSARWEYTMVFSSNFSSIEGGQVRAFRADGSESTPHRFGIHLRYGRVVEGREELLALLAWIAGAA